MKKLLFLTVVFSGLAAYAQEYNITFEGSGASSMVETVKVENLTRGLSVTLNGNDILHLSTPTGAEPLASDSSAIRIYPNPVYCSSTLEIIPPAAGDATITLFDMSGKVVALLRSSLDISVNNFRLSGLKPGLYIIDVKGLKYDLSGRLISNGPAGPPRIEKLISGTISLNKSPLNKSLRGLTDDRYLEYSPGDLLKFTGTSGKYRTVVTDDPDDSKSITFNFVTCTDADNNNYAVVKIGEYTWMAENLKTTKYKDGTPIPYQVFNADTPDSLIWTWEGYSWYNNDQGNKNIYGALYKMNTFKSGKLCPVGWHAPNHSEWVNLADVMGGPSESGGRLKETETSHWAYPNTGATNESGFTALPGGRLDHNKFLGINNEATFWSVTKCGGSNDCGWSIGFNGTKISWSDLYEEVGYSVRCVYGEEPKIPEVRTTP
ncbi:MAG: FISUMP domain-containing protein, partial [Methanosarcina sp.]